MELLEEIRCLEREVRERKAKSGELTKTVNNMKEVSCSYTVLTPWLPFLCPLLFHAVIF